MQLPFTRGGTDEDETLGVGSCGHRCDSRVDCVLKNRLHIRGLSLDRAYWSCKVWIICRARLFQPLY